MPTRNRSLRALRVSIKQCSLAELRQLETWMHGSIAKAEATEIERQRSSRVVVKERATPNDTYRLELVRCGKETCKVCRGGPAHGPYWYVYWKDGGRTRSAYIGKKLKPWRPPRGQSAPGAPRTL